MNVDDYKQMCYDILNNTVWYKHFFKGTTVRYQKEFSQILIEAYQSGAIDKDTYKSILVKNPFYALPKTHKNIKKAPGRPIISGIGSDTEKN